MQSFQVSLLEQLDGYVETQLATGEYATPAEYKQHYDKHYCREKIFTFDSIRVHFRQSKFGHVFYESSARDGKKDTFSQSRAERIGWIRATLEHPKAELYQGWNKDDKVYDNSRRVSVVYDDFVLLDSYGKGLNLNQC